MIVITGAAGFIGSNLAHRLAGLGRELVLVDHPLTAQKAANWAGLPRFRFVTHDRFLDELRHERRPAEAVFHLGACSRTTEADWNYLSRNNLAYSWRLWTWCVESRSPFYYASSAATYGDGADGFDDRTPPSQLRPLNSYARSKNDFDRWVLHEVAVGRPTPPSWAGLKFFNVYGPRETHKGDMASVIWKARAQVLEGGTVCLFKSDHPDYPDGGQRRDFVFVEDVIDHLLWLWETPRVSGLFNSGTGQARTFRDLALAVFAALGREPRICYQDMPTVLKGMYQYHTQAVMSKLRAAGYSQAPTSLDDGVRRSFASGVKSMPP